MIKNRKPSPLNSAELLATIRGMLAHHHHDWGLLSLGGVLLALSLLAGVQMGQRPGIYLAGEIAAHLGVTPAAASYHLAKLKKAELITESRRKNFIDYQLNTSVFEEILLWFQQFSKEEEK